MVVHGSNAHKFMMGCGNNVGSGCWKGGEEDIAQHRGAVERTTCCSNEYLERAWDDFHAWEFGSEVAAAGAGVGYCGILWWNGRLWGGATGREMRIIFIIKCTN